MIRQHRCTCRSAPTIRQPGRIANHDRGLRNAAARNGRTWDLVVFLAVLGAGTVLVLCGVAPESLATIAVAVSGLYTVWRGPQPPA
ncbi:hypothetical protein GCM10020221_22600 [Streptomyces thioluteus]|uniref:Uncharacterized protein n=1 Tax=Streptomyces thioluteus TaxID=66431 RepID=A0ABN3WSH6_STRTU